MKISILKESLCIGGTERSASNISVALAKKHDVTTVLYHGSDRAYPYGGELLDLNLPAKTGKIQKLINNIKRSSCYKKHINEFEPEIAFQFLSVKSPVGFLKLENCVKIVSCRDFSSLQRDIKLFKKRLDTSDAMICNSEYLRGFFIKKHPEDKNKVFAVHNIIDMQSIIKRSEEETDDAFDNFKKKHGRIIVSTGRFCKEKAFENLIEAFAKVREAVPEAGLVLIGDGQYKDRYLETAEKLGVSDALYFTGYQKNPYKYMAKCDAFVLSSLSEGFPNVLAEAMALSLPVISVNCFTGPAEILMKEHDYKAAKEDYAECDYGILTPHYDVKGTDFAVEKMSEAVIRLLSDDALMRKYAEKAAERAEIFSAQAATEKLENIFETLISERKQ